MKLIEAEKAKDVIHEYFKSLMINGASGTDVYKLAVGIVSCLEHDANLLKAIDELPSAEPEQRWIPVTEESVIQAGYEGREVRFRIRGRLFAIRELAQ